MFIQLEKQLKQLNQDENKTAQKLQSKPLTLIST